MDEYKTTETIRRRYDRFAHLYDFIVDGVGRSRFHQWRKLLWSKAEGTLILEVGVGTGGNLVYYPQGAELTAIDFSKTMLKRARKRAIGQRAEGRLLLMDAQNLGFRDNTFDTVVASLVFCSVPDPVRGFREIKRVVKPGGKVLLLEHVLSSNRFMAGLMNMVNPLTLAILGDNINRKTVENVARSGLVVEKVTDLGGIFKLIEARVL
ncbi:MAG: class I SAM-dependent methyltransferase [Dehalococcoidales bacterium]|nr:class I SAM-dependent methyltransferase [Dehalococcoidales bacterium]